MEELRNLNDLAKQVVQNYNEKFDARDCKIPQAFKDSVKRLKTFSVVYNEYSVIIKGDGVRSKDSYVPNQSFFMASFFIEYSYELSRYKQKIMPWLSNAGISTNDLTAFFTHERDKGKENVKNGEDKFVGILDKIGYDGADRDYLIKFVTDYDWWSGSKTIERSDFFNSPVLSIMGLTASSNAAMALIVDHLTQHPELSSLLLDQIEIANMANNFMGNHQQIFYGAPGTGKSNTIKREVDDKGKLNFRTTFHPDSDYSTFVGCYKPKMKRSTITKDGVTITEEKIIYSFEPQAFTNAYVQAWKTHDDVYLIIEEINRGNCAQIFGDLFQLLDRKNGESEYPVDADSSLADYLQIALADSKRDDIPTEVKNGTKLKLPSNLYIWATMNTSDQSLFPIDSAFKRRWEWKYIPIDTKKESWSIAVDGENYSWTSFLEIINERVFKATSSEDKQLGFYFCKAQNNVVSAETFVSKVLFYLWNDVFKDYDEGNSIFKDSEGEKLPFSKFYNTDGSVNNAMVKKLLTALEIERSVDLVEADKDGNNFDCYSLNGSEPKGKSDLGLSIMEQYLSEHSGANFDEIKQVFPDSMLGNVANRGLIVEESTPLDSYSRYYTPKSFTSADGIRYRIYKQWTVSNIGNIIGFAREQGWNVEQRERKDNQA